MANKKADRQGEAVIKAALSSETAIRYDPTTIWLHWLTAILVVLLWGMAELSGFVPRGPARHNLWTIHILLGALLLFVIALRIVWRATRPPLSASRSSALLDGVDKIVHKALYLLLVGVVLLGVGNVWARGWDFFGLIAVPPYDPNDTKRALAHSINGWHNLAANILIAVAAAHALAALIHHYILRDGVLGRMRLTS